MTWINARDHSSMQPPESEFRPYQFRLLTLAKALTACCAFAALAQFAAGRYVYGWLMWIVLLSAAHYAIMCGLTWTGRKVLATVYLPRRTSPRNNNFRG